MSSNESDTSDNWDHWEIDARLAANFPDKLMPTDEHVHEIGRSQCRLFIDKIKHVELRLRNSEDWDQFSTHLREAVRRYLPEFVLHRNSQPPRKPNRSTCLVRHWNNWVIDNDTWQQANQAVLNVIKASCEHPYRVFPGQHSAGAAFASLEHQVSNPEVFEYLDMHSHNENPAPQIPSDSLSPTHTDATFSKSLLEADCTEMLGRRENNVQKTKSASYRDNPFAPQKSVHRSPIPDSGLPQFFDLAIHGTPNNNLQTGHVAHRRGSLIATQTPIQGDLQASSSPQGSSTPVDSSEGVSPSSRSRRAMLGGVDQLLHITSGAGSRELEASQSHSIGLQPSDPTSLDSQSDDIDINSSATSPGRSAQDHRPLRSRRPTVSYRAEPYQLRHRSNGK